MSSPLPRLVRIIALYSISIVVLSSASLLSAPMDPQQPTSDPSSTTSVDPTDLTSLSLEQLSNMEVTSVSRRPQRESSAAAAVFVITGEDIRRAGVTSIVEALRLAPGVNVARINSNQYSVGVRGFGNRLSREMLVLIDGRSVYSPLFHGTYWETQDTLLEDIDRIEVIRGPGGTLWGANAVNGVINIITKHSKSTQGVFASAGGGTLETGFGNVRYGGSQGDAFTYRAYGKYFDRNHQYSTTGNNFDDWRMGQVGFRTDWKADENNDLTTQGDIYQGRQGQRATFASYTPPFLAYIRRDAHVFGGNLLTRWKRKLQNGSDTALQVSYDRTQREDAVFLEDRNTYDVDFQHHIPMGSRHDFMWGAQFRLTNNRTDGLPTYQFDPSRRTDRTYSGFIQDTIALLPDTLDLTIGSKFEHNDYSGWEIQPNSRLAWMPNERHTLWTAISRAVRTPSAIEQDAFLTLPISATTPAFNRLYGNKDFRSEEVIAYELGYRVQPVEPVLLDIAGFYNQYDRMFSINPGTPFAEATPGVPHTVTPYVFGNDLEGHSHGLEFASTYFVRSNWRLRSSYSFVTLNLRKNATSTDSVSLRSLEGSTPRHQVVLQSLMSLPYGFEVDPTARFVDNLSATGIPSYWSCDLHLGWHPTKHVELALVGQNLLARRHAESGTLQEIERGIYGQISYRTW